MLAAISSVVSPWSERDAGPRPVVSVVPIADSEDTSQLMYGAGSIATLGAHSLIPPTCFRAIPKSHTLGECAVGVEWVYSGCKCVVGV
jgi:hypothetical protein